MIPAHRTAVLGLMVLLAAATVAGCRGRQPQVNFLIAYSHLSQDEQGGVRPAVDNRDGLRTAIGLDVPVTETDANGSGIRLGGRLAFSGYRERTTSRTVAGEPLLRIEEFNQLTIMTPQFVASYRQVFGDPRRGAGFIEPGLGAGLAFGVLSFGSDLEFGDQTIGTDIDRSQSTASFALNPFLRGGYQARGYLIGLEGGYQWTGLEFDNNLGRNAQEWYVGIFFALQLGP